VIRTVVALIAKIPEHKIMMISPTSAAVAATRSAADHGYI